ncbi:MAG: MbnH family di-heme enzyme [Acidobacteriota bacterium]
MPRHEQDIGARLALAALAMAVAGVVHLEIAPAHFAHAPAHGLFFGLLGVLQVAWVVAVLAVAATVRGSLIRRVPRTLGALRASGLCLGGGAVVLWVLTQWVRTPFAVSPEPIDGPTVISKVAELVSAIALVAASSGSVGAPRRRPRMPAVIAPAAIVLASGAIFWIGGLTAEARFPSLRPDPAEAGHDHGEHAHFGTEEELPSFPDASRSALRLVTALFEPQSYDWGLPAGFPVPRVPEGNPMTAAKVELGRHLFYDQRLSGNGEQSCASCHRQELAFSDGEALARGSTGEIHPRNSMALVNVAFNASLTWAHPQLELLEDQIPTPMFGLHPIELGITGHEDEVLDRIRRAGVYERLFRDAFPGVVDPVNWDTIVQALASFTRALVSADSAYDRFVYSGQADALSPSALRGMELFLSEEFECHHCHGGFNFSVASVHQTTAFDEKVFHNTGLYDLGDGAYPYGNQGAFEVTHEPDDRGKFRPPTLRNVAVTAPYMHDGSIATLEEVIETYASGGRLIESGPHAGDGRRNPLKSGFVPGFPMTDDEKADLIAFLHALTDETFLTDPRFSDPFAATIAALD